MGGQFPNAGVGDQNVYVVLLSLLQKCCSSGTGDEQFKRTRGIALDSSGNVYVADSNNNRIQKFNSNGKFITKWDSSGTGDEQFYGLRGIAIGFSGNVYARDWGNNWVQVFSPSSNG